jgi:hypothetical protein
MLLKINNKNITVEPLFKSYKKQYTVELGYNVIKGT